MSRTLSVKLRGQDEDFLYRTLDIRIGSQQTLTTPIRAIDARLVRRLRDADPLEARLFEAYMRPSASTVDARMNEKEKELALSYELNAIRRTAGSAPLLLLQEFNETNYPNQKQLEFMVRTAHSYSDMLILPLVSRITDRLDAGDGFSRYLDFLEMTLDTIDTYNKKPLMGVIPMKIPFIRIEDLVKFYCERIEMLPLAFSPNAFMMEAFQSFHL